MRTRRNKNRRIKYREFCRFIITHFGPQARDIIRAFQGESA